MPKTKRAKPLYQRGGFRLDRRSDRGNLVITWYDPAIGRERLASAATAEIEAGKAALDRKFLEVTQGRRFCPACGQATDRQDEGGRLVTEALELYLHATETRASADAIGHRLAHVTSYIATLPSPGVRFGEVDERWIARFRSWAQAQPVVSPAGTERPRALSTVENSVLQLAAAIRHSGERPRFKPIPMKELNRTPRRRAKVALLGEMFRYALTEKKKRENVLAFLRASIATLGRPDAVHDISTAPERGQWDAVHHVLDLNPRGRRQTKKRRATVPIARQAVWLFERCDGFLLPVGSVKKGVGSMMRKLKLPADGEAGMKLIRRSLADEVRRRLVAMEKPIEELEVFLGHRTIDAVTELYAPFDPAYLRNVKGIIEAIIDEVEALAPGAFYRDLTAKGGNVASIARGLSA